MNELAIFWLLVAILSSIALAYMVYILVRDTIYAWYRGKKYPCDKCKHFVCKTVVYNSGSPVKRSDGTIMTVDMCGKCGNFTNVSRSMFGFCEAYGKYYTPKT